MKQNDFFEILPSYLKETKDLTLGSKNVLAALLFLNNNEYSKENGFFFRSNKDLMKDSQVSEPTLIKSLIQLESFGFIERKVGKRGNGASEYKLNEHFTQSLKVNFSNNFSNQERVKIQGFEQSLKKDFSNNTKKEDFSNQNPNKQRDLEENFSKDFSNNFSTDTDTEVDIDIINKLNNNIIILNNNLNKLINIIEEKENIFINKNIKEKETLVNEEKVTSSETLVKENLEFSNNNYIFAKEPLTVETTKKELNHIPTENNKINETSKDNKMIIETSTPSNLTAEKAIIEHFNKENAAKHAPSEHYNIILPSEQKRIFNELIARMKISTSMEELADKHIKMQKYMNEHTFMVSYIDEEKRIFKELKEKLNTSTENENKVPSSPSNVLDGIVISPNDLKPLDANKTASDQVEADIEQAESPNEPFLSPTSPSNDLGGVVDHTDGENSADAKEMPLNQKNYNPLEIVEKIKAERMEGLRKAIDDATTIQELRDAAKKVNSLRNSLSTDEMAELAEIMDSKVKYL